MAMNHNTPNVATLGGWNIGAHLVSPRRGYVHHGIYQGAGLVIHYAGLSAGRAGRGLGYGPVELIDVIEFAHGRSVDWIEEPFARYHGEAVVRRARSRLGEDRYRLLSNNCEHFCSWCIHGEHRSSQVESFFNLRAARRSERHVEFGAAMQ
jgi:hypothetical protein